MNIKLKPLATNMTELETPKYIVLFSYKTPVACIDRTTNTYYRTDKKWSATTSRHVNKWLEGATAQLQPQQFFDTLI